MDSSALVTMPGSFFVGHKRAAFRTDTATDASHLLGFGGLFSFYR